MTKQFRKLWLLALFGMMSVGAWADGITTAADLKTAVEGLTTDDQTITLGAKITLTDNINCSHSFTLELGDYSITKGSYSIALGDDVKVTTSKSTTVFTTSVENKNVCYKRLESGYSYHVATAVAKNTYFFFETLEDAITYYANSTSQTTITLLSNVSLSTDIVSPGIGTLAYLYIKQGDFSLTTNGHKIYLRRDIIAGTDKDVNGLFAKMTDDDACELITLVGTTTYPYRYQSVYTKEAKIGDTEYETFAAAAEAATNGETITLLKSGISYTMTTEQTLKVKRVGCTIEGNDHSYTITVNAPANYVVAKSSAQVEGYWVDTYTVETASVEYTNGEVVSSLSAMPSAPGNGTYKLLKDITVSFKTYPLGISASNVTIDLNGHTFTNTAASSSSNYCFGLIRTNQKLTITDSSEGKTGKIVSNNGIYVDQSGNELTIEAAIEVTGDFAVATNGSTTTSGSINIKDGAQITSNTVAVYLPGKTETTISGGTITGSTGVYQKSGTLTITGGTINGTGAKEDFAHYDNGVNSTGDALVIENCGYPGGDPTVSISGGTFTSTNADAIASYATEGHTTVTGFITAGTYSSDPSDYLANNYSAVKINDVYLVGEEIVKEETDDDAKEQSYTIVGDKAVVTEVQADAEATSLTIPAAVDGKNVAYIADDAFDHVADKTAVQSIDLSATQITGVEVDRTSGVFAGFPEETLIYMPAGNTAATGEKNVIVKDASDNLVCADFALTDEKSYSIPVAFTATNVTLTRDFTSGKTSTVCLPYALPTAGISGTFYYFHSVDGTTVKMKQVTASSLTAYQPYIFVPSTDATEIANSDVNVTIAASDAATKTKGNEEGSTSFTFTGTIEKKEFSSSEIASGIYGFAAEDGHGGSGVGSFVKCSDGAYIEGLRAYLVCNADLDAAGAAASRGFGDDDTLPQTMNIVLVNADGSVTGIGQVKLIMNEDGASYNLKGERITKNTKGVVIKNGKKIYIK